VLKLDRRFTTATAANTRGRQVAEAVIQLANTLNIKVVAEGIETQSQLDVLTQIGCHLGQGFFWAKAQRAPWLGEAEPNTQGQIAHGSADITVSADSTEAPGNGLPLYDPVDNHSGMACPAEEFIPKSIESERRSESRVAILLHVAKLVVDEHEHFCIIRDASSTGLKVKLFAPLPNHEDLAVELANGERYKAQCVWTNGKNIGLQFCEPFPLDHLLDHSKHVGRRRHLRLRTALDGMLQIGEKTASITVRDISQHGAALETKKWLSVNELVKIQVPALPDVYAKVRWRNHPYYGVVFERTFQLEELATRVFAAQAHAARKRHDGAYG
jgi:EAL domain-containing protein (putative c-di-GMP-specific phosphodiesterase class I)